MAYSGHDHVHQGSDGIKGDSSVFERFGELDILQRPQCLVFTDGSMNLKIEDSVLDQISRIDVPISVIGMCGVYRTGKSYLMNRLAGKQTGFSLGYTTQSKTKGIWAWCHPHPKFKDQVLLLLDTEGLCDAKMVTEYCSLLRLRNLWLYFVKNDYNHDVKIFCLTMLMSSCLIYNIKGVIDQDALDKLFIVADATKQISVSGNEFANEEEDRIALRIISPYFVLCLRDFYYKLVDDGEMTADEYMEHCLEDTSEMHNIKQNIKTFFPRRKCFTLSQPAMNKKLTDLENLSEEEIDNDFMKDVETLIDFLYTLGPKCLDEVSRKIWDGNAFKSFLGSFITDISKGQTMEYGNAIQNACKHHNSKLKDEICRIYQTELEYLEIQKPSTCKLSDHAEKIKFNLLTEFRQKAYPILADKYTDKVTESMKRKRDALVAKNSDKIVKRCLDYLDNHHKKMLEDNATRYDNKHGDSNYEEDLGRMLQKYESEFHSYDSAEKHDALKKFKDSTIVYKTKLEYQATLQQEIEKFEMQRKSDEVVAKKRDEVKKFCFDYLSSHYKKMLEDNAAKYESKHGVSKYEEDLDGLLHKFESEFHSYDSAARNEALQNFKDSTVTYKAKLEYQAKLHQEMEKYAEEQKNTIAHMEAAMKKKMENLRNKKRNRKVKKKYDKKNKKSHQIEIISENPTLNMLALESEEEHKKKIADMEDGKKKVMENLGKEKAKEIQDKVRQEREKLEEEQKKKIDDMEADKKKVMENLRKKEEEEIQEKAREEREKLEKKQKKIIADMEAAKKKKMEKQRKKRSRKIKKKYEKQKNKIEEEQEKTIADMEAAMKDKVENLRKKEEQEIQEKLGQENIKIEEEQEKAIADMKAAMKKKMRNQRQKRSKKIKKKYAKQKKKIEEKQKRTIADMKAAMKKTMKNKRKKWSRKIKQKYDKQKKKIEEEQNKKIADVEASWKKEKQERQAEFEKCKKRSDAFSNGSIDCFARLKYLFTGSMEA